MAAPAITKTLSDFTSLANSALELHRAAPDAAKYWRAFLKMLEAYEQLDVEQCLEALDAMIGVEALLPMTLALARSAVRRFPRQARAWGQLGYAQLLDDRRSPTAYIALERAWQLAPDMRMDLAASLSAAYIAVQRWSDAESICRFLIKARPDSADAHSNLSIALRGLLRSEAAAEAAREALRIDGRHEHAAVNLGHALIDCGHYDEALLVLRRGLEENPADDRYRLPLGELELRLGQWETGWAKMHARFSLPGLREQLHARETLCGVPHWRGESLRGKTLGIWLEQGYGDAILLVRYLPLFTERVRQQGGKLLFGCFGALHELFRPWIPADVEVDVDHLRSTDYHLPLMSGCAAFGVTQHLLPGAAYLGGDTLRTQVWRRRWGEDHRLHVALTWSGNPDQSRDALRSLDARALQELLSIPGVLFHSLNPNVAKQARELASQGLPIVDHSHELSSFADSAALLAAMDRVVSICTATAHLAGAIGAPTLLLLDKVGSYLWGQDDQMTPWYNSVRIIRQQTLGDWTDVIQRTRQVLQQECRDKQHCLRITDSGLPHP